MKLEDIEITTGPAEKPYGELGTARCNLSSGPIGKQRTFEEANAKLREIALGMGANAVVNVTYKRGPSLLSWRSLTAEGDAVLLDVQP